MSIRKSMYRIILIMAVVPYTVFSLLIVGVYTSRLDKVITESLQVVAKAQVAEMIDFCERQRDYLFILGTMDVSRAAMSGELEENMIQYLDNMLYSRVRMMNYLNTLALVDKNYRVVSCSTDHKFFADVGIYGLIRQMGDQNFYFSDILINKQGEKTLVAITRIESGEEFLGYALAEISLDFYENIREQAELWNGSTFYLLDGKQQIISAGTSEERREHFVTTEKEREDYIRKYGDIDFEKEPQGSFRYKVSGVDYITYYSDMEYTHWRVMLTVNLDNYQAQKGEYYVLAALMVLVCAVLVIWIGWFASKRIIRPIRHISDTLREIQQTQDYSLRIKVGRRDELGNLAGEINGLLDFIETEDLYKTQQQRLLRQKAEQDALTKVLNKERITQYLQDALERSRLNRGAMAVLFIDVDDFKAFNSSYGHNVGDQVLLFLTSLLERELNGTVGRVGGDEFLVVMETSEDMHMLDMCLKWVEKLAGSQFVVRATGEHLPIFCCIGAVRVDFAACDSEGLTAERLIELSDTAMYQVKNGGKHGHVIWDYCSRTMENDILKEGSSLHP